MTTPTDRAIAQAFFAVLSDPSVSWKNEPAKKFLDAVADLAGKIDADAAGSTTVERNRDAIASEMANLSSRYDSPKFKFDLLTAMLQAAPAGAPAGAWVTEPLGLYDELRSVLNRHSAENASNTPDYVLASFLLSSLDAFNNATNRRQSHYYGATEAPDHA